MPTPVDPISGGEDMEVKGNTATLFNQASIDTIRYAKLFKLHVEKNNTRYKVHVNRHYISITHEMAGINESIDIYPYKAGVAKAPYLSLVLNEYNMEKFLKCISEIKFTPFPDNEYHLKPTPEPMDFLKSKFKLVNGKWM